MSKDSVFWVKHMLREQILIDAIRLVVGDYDGEQNPLNELVTHAEVLEHVQTVQEISEDGEYTQIEIGDGWEKVNVTQMTIIELVGAIMTSDRSDAAVPIWIVVEAMGLIENKQEAIETWAEQLYQGISESCWTDEVGWIKKLTEMVDYIRAMQNLIETPYPG